MPKVSCLICDIYTSLFTGLRFEEIADSIIWHHDINVYSVYDLRSCELLGYLYLDLYKRFILGLEIVDILWLLYLSTSTYGSKNSFTGKASMGIRVSFLFNMVRLKMAQDR